MRADRLQTNTYPISHRPARAALCLLLGAGIPAYADGAAGYFDAPEIVLTLSMLRLVANRRSDVELIGGSLPFSLGSPATAVPSRATPSPKRAEGEITLAAHTWYALQLGAFTQEGSARQLAQEHIARGAAGYVQQQDSTYRVLAAAYPTRAEAQAVQTRLSAQNVGVYIHPFTQPELSLRAQGSADQVEAVRETLAYLDALADKLGTLSCALDAHDMDADAARSALQSEGSTCAGLKKRLLSAFEGELPALLSQPAALLDSICAESDALQKETSAARTGAALKRCQLAAAVGMMDFAAALQGR